MPCERLEGRLGHAGGVASAEAQRRRGWKGEGNLGRGYIRALRVIRGSTSHHAFGAHPGTKRSLNHGWHGGHGCWWVWDGCAASPSGRGGALRPAFPIVQRPARAGRAPRPSHPGGRLVAPKRRPAPRSPARSLPPSTNSLPHPSRSPGAEALAFLPSTQVSPPGTSPAMASTRRAVLQARGAVVGCPVPRLQARRLLPSTHLAFRRSQLPGPSTGRPGLRSPRPVDEVGGSSVPGLCARAVRASWHHSTGLVVLAGSSSPRGSSVAGVRRFPPPGIAPRVFWGPGSWTVGWRCPALGLAGRGGWVVWAQARA